MEPISKQKIQQRKVKKQLPTNFTTYTLLFILFSLIYECQLKRPFEKGSRCYSTEALVAGSIAGAISRAFTAPLDTIKIRLQLQP